MIKNQDNSGSFRKAPKLSEIGIVSLIAAFIAIPLMFISFNRIKRLQDKDICLVKETPAYTVIHSLCPILSAVSIAFGSLSVIRCRRDKSGLSAAIPGSAGILVSLTSLTIYTLALLSLVKGYL